MAGASASFLSDSESLALRQLTLGVALELRSGQVRFQVITQPKSTNFKLKDRESGHKAACQWATSKVSTGLNLATLE